MDHFAETSAVHSSNQPKIDGILPDRKEGHEVRQASMTSAYDLGCLAIHSTRSATSDAFSIVLGSQLVDMDSSMLLPPPHLVHPHGLLANRASIVIPLTSSNR